MQQCGEVVAMAVAVASGMSHTPPTTRPQTPMHRRAAGMRSYTRETETETETESETETEVERQRQRQTDRQTDTHTHTKSASERAREKARERAPCRHVVKTGDFRANCGAPFFPIFFPCKPRDEVMPSDSMKCCELSKCRAALVIQRFR